LEGLQESDAKKGPPANDATTSKQNEKSESQENNNLQPKEYYMNHQGFFTEGDSDFGDYVGNTKPSEDQYKELEKIDNKLYHKNTSNFLASATNKLIKSLGLDAKLKVKKNLMTAQKNLLMKVLNRG